MSLRTRDRMRSQAKIEMVFVEANGNIKRAHLPIGLGHGDGTAIYWTNLGWIPADKYDSDQHKAKVEAEQRVAAIKAEEEKVEKADAERKAAIEAEKEKAQSKKVK